MLRRLLKIVAVLVVLVIGALLAAFFYIDSLARRGIERGATYALGVDTKLTSADVKVLAGEFSMGGLRIANPEGYEADHFLTLDEGDVAVSWTSLREDTVRLPHLNLTGVDMHLVRTAGKANYDVILENLRRFETKPKPDAKKFVIERVTVRNIVAHVDVDPIGLTGLGSAAAGALPGDLGKVAGELTRLDVPIDEIVLNDVGSGTTGGVLLAELSDVLIKAILTAVVQKAGGALPADLESELRSHLAKLEGLEKLADVKSLGGILDAAGDLPRDLGDRARDEVEGVIGDIGGRLGDVLGGGGGGDKPRDGKKRPDNSAPKPDGG